VYGVGKTFFWPTMLGVVGERYPQGGALVMGSMGAMGMLSAGLLGGPAIGFKQDYHAAKHLTEYCESNKDAEHPNVCERFISKEKRSLYGITPAIAGLDPTKVGALLDRINALEAKKRRGEPISPADELTPTELADKGPVLDARLYGGRMALKWTAVVPAMMAVGYLLLVIYFRARGGYKQEHLTPVAGGEG
jgi:hypothetical protein